MRESRRGLTPNLVAGVVIVVMGFLMAWVVGAFHEYEYPVGQNLTYTPLNVPVIVVRQTSRKYNLQYLDKNGVIHYLREIPPGLLKK